MEYLFVALGAALATKLFDYLMSKRKASGRVAVTDADKLWAEARRARRALQKRIKDLEVGEIARRIEIHSLRNELTKLHFIIAGNIPAGIEEKLAEASQAHIRHLEIMLANKQAEPINGDEEVSV